MKGTKKKLIELALLISIIVIIACFAFIISSSKALLLLQSSDQSPLSFSVIVLPDIQNYSSTYPEILCKQTEWIVAQKKALNIVFVSELGDIVNDGAKKMYEWENASKCLGKLDGVIPYSVIPGNHDTDVSSQKSSGFSAFDAVFPVSRFSKYSWYGGYFESNRNNFETITVDSTMNGATDSVKKSTKLLFLNLEVEPSDKALDWASSIARTHLDYYTILTTHKYLAINSNKPDTSISFGPDGNSGENIWEKLIKGNCSISMVLSGHFHGENRISSVNSCGNIVNEVVQDYQDEENGGNGWLRIYTFTPSSRTVDVRTYSPYLNSIETDSSSRFSYSY